MKPNQFCASAGRVLAAAMVISIIILLSAPSAWAATYKTIYRFKGGANGSGPSGLVFDAAGNLYGTTWSGGAFGAGTVFKLDRAGKRTVLHSFGAGYGANPHPYQTLVFDAAGNLYGTTQGGGATGRGTAFELDTSGREITLYSFCINFQFPCPDGAYPTSGLLFDQTGALYGATWVGGDQYVGVVFKLTSDGNGHWSEAVLHSFEISDGDGPIGGLVWDSSHSNFYGTTMTDEPNGWGNVFKMDTTGAETVLHSFLDPNEGVQPYKPPSFDAAGNLYGTDAYGGNASCPGPFGNGCGTVWKLDTNGTLTVLHVFTGGNDGSAPLSGLTVNQSGNFYGMTSAGGSHGFGVVFKETVGQDGKVKRTTLHSFVNRPGAYPCSNLIIDATGNLYGTTQGDGVTTFGSVFEITP